MNYDTHFEGEKWMKLGDITRFCHKAQMQTKLRAERWLELQSKFSWKNCSKLWSSTLFCVVYWLATIIIRLLLILLKAFENLET